MRAIIPEAEADPEGWLADIASRAERRETLSAAGTMVWRVWGQGKPLVLLHGGHGAWNHWCRNVEPLVAAGFRVIVADLPGLGDSADPGPPYTADTLAETVHYGIKNLVEADELVHLAGFSFETFRTLTFEEPDRERFPALDLGYRCVAEGGNAGAVFNAADEVAVEAFLDGALDLPGVVATSAAALAARPRTAPSLEGLLEADRWARDFALSHIDDCAAPVTESGD